MIMGSPIAVLVKRSKLGRGYQDGGCRRQAEGSNGAVNANESSYICLYVCMYMCIYIYIHIRIQVKASP